MKTLIISLITLIAATTFANQILWAALDEGSTIEGTAFRNYVDSEGREVNAARLSIGTPGVNMVNYAMEVVQQLSLWIPPYGGDSGYWETEHPETCLKDEDGEYSMEVGTFGSQFNLGDNPNSAVMVFFELGHVADWDDLDSPFVTLAYAGATITALDAEKHIYPSGTINPPVEAEWAPIQFRAVVPEPSTAILALLGTCLLLKRRKSVCA